MNRGPPMWRLAPWKSIMFGWPWVCLCVCLSIVYVSCLFPGETRTDDTNTSVTGRKMASGLFSRFVLVSIACCMLFLLVYLLSLF